MAESSKRAGKSGGKHDQASRFPRREYERELLRLQGELVKLKEWVRTTDQRLLILFEGRDAAGKGGVIKRITEYLNPRVARTVALPAPTERERGQWYFQRYVAHLPAAGEIVLFDRSWYNRAGVEHVMGFCTPDEYRRFLHQAPIFERLLVEDGMLAHQVLVLGQRRGAGAALPLAARDPLRSWKLSPMDIESRARWVEFSQAKDEMFVHTDIPEAPWYVVEGDDKRRARLNCIAHLVSIVPYEDVIEPPLELPPRPGPGPTQRPPRELFRYVPDHAATLLD